MIKQSIQLEKKVVMVLMSIILLGSGCEDRLDTRGNQSVSEGTPVDVSFRIGLADEADAYTLSGGAETKSSESSDKKRAFSYSLCPTTGTKATPSLKPDSLYNLEIRQYKSDGTYLAGSSEVAAETGTGSLITVTLQEVKKCQLVLVAWGKDNTATRLGAVKLSDAQKVSITNTYINTINPSDQTSINKMPYMLHLTDVNIASDGSLYSADGEAIDIRLLLRRLATRLTVSWTYSASVPSATYQLKQILLQSIPLNYNVVAAPGTDNTYPSLLDQYQTIQLTASDISSGSYSCWLPANVRGTNPAATSLFYRNKQNAPIGSTYIDFQAINQLNTKQKLSYRVYLGSNDSYDFNLHGNRNYTYQVRFAHTTLPTNDLRVSIIDPIPASEGNNNLVPTGNCFMIAPGGSFCFNPYKYSVKGVVTDNALLQEWCTSNKIKSVKVLWQTKESGDVGDPVLGVVNSATDHDNIVALTGGDNFANARIYCRVAPNTTGGSGMIAAYDAAGNILWSWHIWVTDYRPSATEDNSVDDPNKRIQKYTYGNHGNRFPMMDRNLGAMAGYTEIPANELDRSKANGFHYQWGRKDPFPSSYTDKAISAVRLFTEKPTPMMLNLYQPDGFSFFRREYNGTAVSRQTSYKNPTTLYNNGGGKWCNETVGEWWGGNTTKTVNDPCPAGWRVADKNTYLSFFQNVSYSGSGTDNKAAVAMNIGNLSTALNDGGVLLYFEGAPASNKRKTFLRLTGYQNLTDQFSFIGKMSNLWCRERNGETHAFMWVFNNGGLNWDSVAHNVASNWSIPDAHTLRCIQDR